MAPAHLIPSPQDEVRTLRGKVAIVTGASRGLGRAFVDALVEHGAVVACLARPSAELDELARHHGDAVAPFPCDVSDASQIDRAVAGAVERFGRLDVLVNNAAIFHPFLVEEATAAQVEAHIGVNLFGPIWLARAAIPHLRATKGQVVSISSESVRMPFPFLTVYAATKAALEVLSAGLRDEFARRRHPRDGPSLGIPQGRQRRSRLGPGSGPPILRDHPDDRSRGLHRRRRRGRIHGSDARRDPRPAP